MRKNSSAWTDDEIRYLTENHQSVDVYTLATHLDRSADAIRTKALALGLAMPAQRRLKWTPSHSKALATALEAGRTVREIARELRTSTVTIRQRAKQLKMAVNSERPSSGTPRLWSPEDDDVIRRYYATQGISYCRQHLPGRSDAAIYQRASDLEVRRYEPTDRDREWSASDDRSLMQYLRSGESLRAIATVMNATPATVVRHITRLGESRPAPHVDRPAVQPPPLFKQDANWSQNEFTYLDERYPHDGPYIVARDLGRSPTAVRRHALARELPSPPFRKKMAVWTDENIATLRLMAANKRHAGAIATVIGTSPQSVHRQAARLGIALVNGRIRRQPNSDARKPSKAKKTKISRTQRSGKRYFTSS